MKRGRFTETQIVSILKEADAGVRRTGVPVRRITCCKFIWDIGGDSRTPTPAILGGWLGQLH